jgi:hypothetical protein
LVTKLAPFSWMDDLVTGWPPSKTLILSAHPYVRTGSFSNPFAHLEKFHDRADARVGVFKPTRARFNNGIAMSAYRFCPGGTPLISRWFRGTRYHWKRISPVFESRRDSTEGIWTKAINRIFSSRQSYSPRSRATRNQIDQRTS